MPEKNRKKAKPVKGWMIYHPKFGLGNGWWPVFVYRTRKQAREATPRPSRVTPVEIREI